MAGKSRINTDNEVKVDMTPMIDIVFQLLVFFIMTFKVVPLEGDFTIKMPLLSDNVEQDIIEELPTIIAVTLNAGANGAISSIDADNEIDGKSFEGTDMFLQLTSFIESSLSGVADPSESARTEVEFDIDYGLKYKHTVKGIESVSGTVNPDGSIRKLIESVKFKDNSGGG